MEPGEGKMTASARLTALPEGWVQGRLQGRLQGKPVIPQDTDACCRESAECRGKVDEPEPSKEVRLEGNSGWGQRRGGTVVGLAAGLEECAAGWPAQRAANAAT